MKKKFVIFIFFYAAIIHLSIGAMHRNNRRKIYVQEKNLTIKLFLYLTQDCLIFLIEKICQLERSFNERIKDGQQAPYMDTSNYQKVHLGTSLEGSIKYAHCKHFFSNEYRGAKNEEIKEHAEEIYALLKKSTPMSRSYNDLRFIANQLMATYNSNQYRQEKKVLINNLKERISKTLSILNNLRISESIRNTFPILFKKAINPLDNQEIFFGCSTQESPQNVLCILETMYGYNRAQQKIDYQNTINKLTKDSHNSIPQCAALPQIPFPCSLDGKGYYAEILKRDYYNNLNLPLPKSK